MSNIIKELEENRYQSAFREFWYKNPSATENFYIEYRIRIIKEILLEYNKTANFVKGEELDGKELIDGVLTTTKMGTATAYIQFDKELSFLKGKLKQLKNSKQPEPKATVKKDIKEQTPFLVGLKFANGEAQELYKKYKGEKGHFKKICLELGFKDTDRPYFSETLNNNRKGIKNIYNKKGTLIQVYNYCTENKIVMCDGFLEKYNQIELE